MKNISSFRRNQTWAKNRGFTFSELMVSVVIIAILAGIVFANVQYSRKAARTAQRIADMKRVQTALDLYYANNRSYPSTGGSLRGICSSYNGSGAYTATNGQVIPGLAPTYISSIPIDPQSTVSSNNNCYLYKSNGTDYAFIDFQVTELSNGSFGTQYSSRSELVDPARDGGSNASIVDGSTITAWKVYSPGGVAF